MIYFLAFVALVLATAMSARVLVVEEVATPLREWIFRKFGETSKPAKLVRCWWCSGFWFAGAWTGSSALWAAWQDHIHTEDLLLVPLTWFAVAYLSGRVLDSEES